MFLHLAMVPIIVVLTIRYGLRANPMVKVIFLILIILFIANAYFAVKTYKSENN